MKTNYLPGIFAMAIVVVASNILVQFFIGDWLTWGAFTYPFAFLVTDIMNRVYGVAAARRVIVAGFVVGIVCSLIGTQYPIELEPDFIVPAVTLRVAIGSALAFLLAQLTDATIFDRLRSGVWWRAPLFSTLVGSSLDTALFYFIAFSATMAGPLGMDHNTEFFNEAVMTPFGMDMTRWVGTAFVDWLVKLSIALIALAPFRMLVLYLVGRSTKNH